MFSFLNSLSIARRLILISLVYAPPIGVLVYNNIASVGQNITFAEQEKKGNTFQTSLQVILEQLTNRRVMSEQPTEVNAPDSFAKLDASIENAWGVLQSSWESVETDLQLSSAGLAKKNRSQLAFGTVKARWDSLKSMEETSGEAAIKSSVELIANIRGLIGHIGDTSNLILDPDLDSYYLMDITLLALPQTQDRLAEIHGFVDGVLRRQAITDEEKVKLSVYAAMLTESDIGRIIADSQISLNEDKNFYGVSPSYQTNYPPLLKNYVDVTVATLTGFMLGSLKLIWDNATNAESVAKMNTSGVLDSGQIIFALVLVVVGFIVVSLIDHLQSGENPVMRLVMPKKQTPAQADSAA